MIVFRVKSSTDIKKLGGAIFTNIKSYAEIELCCLGAGSLNQSVKSVIIAKSFAVPVGINLIIDTSFDLTEVENQEKNLIKLIVRKI